MKSPLIERFLVYVTSVRRYSPRTKELYEDCLARFWEFVHPIGENNDTADANSFSMADANPAPVPASDNAFITSITSSNIRRYEVMLMNGGISPRTINLHLSALSSFCKFLIKEGLMNSNPVKLVKKPKTAKRLPEFYKESDMETYFAATDIFVYSPESQALTPADPAVLPAVHTSSPADPAKAFAPAPDPAKAFAPAPAPAADPARFISAYISSRPRGWRESADPDYRHMTELADRPDKFYSWLYQKRLERVVVATLYATGIRRSELISLTCDSIDGYRKILRVKGKGDKLREIPIISSLYEEISLYLQTVGAVVPCERTAKSQLFVTLTGRALYPALVDRLVKEGLGTETGITGKKSPHVLRHTVATGLLDSGADLNSIKEFLGHSSLAATQVYTHNTVAKLKQIYQTAHPRAKNGGKNGD